MPTIVFVCYGNICRSPFAEHYARKTFAEDGLSAWTLRSAGVGAISGTPSPRPARQAASHWDVDLSPHRATHVNDLDLGPCDLLLASDRQVFAQLALNLSGTLADIQGPGGSKLRLLMQEIDLGDGGPRRPSLDVPDPMGLDVRAYLTSYGIIAATVDALTKRLLSTP